MSFFFYPKVSHYHISNSDCVCSTVVSGRHKLQCLLFYFTHLVWKTHAHLRHSSSPFEHVCWQSALPDKCIIASMTDSWLLKCWGNTSASWLSVRSHSGNYQSDTVHTLLWFFNDHFCFKEGEERMQRAHTIMPPAPNRATLMGKTPAPGNSRVSKLLLLQKTGNCFWGNYNLWKNPQIQIFMVTQQIVCICLFISCFPPDLPGVLF